jgi:hypothetical protein
MADPSKHDVLEALLDTQRLAGEWFDAVESETFTVTREALRDLSELIHRLNAVHTAMTYDYILSGKAAMDMFPKPRPR